MKGDHRATEKINNSSFSMLWESFFITRELTQRPEIPSNYPSSLCKILTIDQNYTSSPKRSWISPCLSHLCSRYTYTKICLIFLAISMIWPIAWIISPTRMRCNVVQHITMRTCKSYTSCNNLMDLSVASQWLRLICTASSKLEAWQRCRSPSILIIYKT